MFTHLFKMDGHYRSVLKDYTDLFSIDKRQKVDWANNVLIKSTNLVTKTEKQSNRVMTAGV